MLLGIGSFHQGFWGRSASHLQCGDSLLVNIETKLVLKHLRQRSALGNDDEMS